MRHRHPLLLLLQLVCARGACQHMLLSSQAHTDMGLRRWVWDV
jgi:hypothetical protein